MISLRLNDNDNGSSKATKEKKDLPSEASPLRISRSNMKKVDGVAVRVMPTGLNKARGDDLGMMLLNIVR